MSKILGANWVSTVWGAIFAIATAISMTPSIIEPLPDSVEPYIKMICALIIAVAGTGFAVSVKSKNVTGGTVQQTADHAVAAPSSQHASSSVIETNQARPQS